MIRLCGMFENFDTVLKKKEQDSGVVCHKNKNLKNNVFIITGEMEFYNPSYFIGKTQTHRT